MVLVTTLVLGTGAWADRAQEQVAAKVAALYQQGVNALKEGDVKLARESFTTVLRIEPGHGNARYQLLKMKSNGPRYASLVRQKKLSQIKIPAVDFEGTSLPEAVEGLDILITKETKGEFAPNFIIQDPNGIFEKRPVTIKLGKVPASVVLEYIVRMANASVRYDEHAIVIRPIGGGAAKTPPAAAERGENDNPFDK
jgi:hypothetical protein